MAVFVLRNINSTQSLFVWNDHNRRCHHHRCRKTLHGKTSRCFWSRRDVYRGDDLLLRRIHRHCNCPQYRTNSNREYHLLIWIYRAPDYEPNYHGWHDNITLERSFDGTAIITIHYQQLCQCWNHRGHLTQLEMGLWNGKSSYILVSWHV